MISIEHSLKVIDLISHLIRADNAETRNLSRARRSCRCSVYLRMSRTWRVGGIEFQCRLAWFVISKRLELRGQLAVIQNGVWKAIEWIRRKRRFANRNGGVPDVECRVGKGSADVDRGARNVIKERLSSGAAIHAEHHPTGREVRVQNEIQALLIEVGEWIEERWLRYQSANPYWRAPTWIEERLFFRSSTNGEGGGDEAAHHVELMSSAVASAAMQSYHHGRAKFTSIFILRKHNRNLLSSGILIQRTMNSCSHQL